MRMIMASDCTKVVGIVFIVEVRGNGHPFVFHHPRVGSMLTPERPYSWDWFASLYTIFMNEIPNLTVVYSVSYGVIRSHPTVPPSTQLLPS
jgi:hypothetical protein